MRSSTFLIAAVLVAMSPFAAADEANRDWSAYPMTEGRFEGTWESLQQYECPAWFRDAKLGFWAIIGPQCVPMQGDWYARHMYIQGHRQYEHHVKAYDHPSKFGYKDLVKLFDPEQLDFDRLVRLYGEAGAKYVVLLAVHHDNFDLWNSKHHEWNSVKKGPRRDLVGEFRDAALKHKLRFGVTTHLARSYSWFQTNKGADKTGPMKGVPYDGTDPKYASLYHPPFKEHKSYPQNPPEAWSLNWYLRVKDLIDQYQPDVMYFDGELPFDDGAVGKRVVAHYYNVNSAWHGGRNDAAMCVKRWGGKSFRPDTCVQDIERGRAAKIAEYPWQTDTCIGGWYYRTGTRYKSVEHVVHMLIDIVSKNGNLLLNIPLHPNGSIDDEEEAFLRGMAKWTKVNGEALYGTRPWLVYGEGATKGGGGHFNERKTAYQPGDLRFAARGDREISAFVMAWPEGGKLSIRSLAKQDDSKAVIDSVEMLGHDGKLTFEHTDDALEVDLPGERPCDHAWALRITGKHLRDFEPEGIGRVVHADAKGNFTLNASDAEIHGETPTLEHKDGAAKQNIGHWGNGSDWVSWKIKKAQPGTYRATVRVSSASKASEFVLEVAGQRLNVSTEITGGWGKFADVAAGQVAIAKAGDYRIDVKPRDSTNWTPMGLLEVRLSRE
jgi:alpha-L-fucosidase